MKKDILVRWIIGILGSLVLIDTWFFTWPAPLHVDKTITSGNVYGVSLLLMVYLMWSAAAALRDYTARINTPNGWFHYNSSQVPGVIGGFYAWTLGGILSTKLPVSTEGSDGTLIAPPDACSYNGENLDVDAVYEEIKPEELPPSWRHALERQGKKKPYYLAVYPAIVHRRAHGKREKLHELMEKSLSVNHAEARLKDVVRASTLSSMHQQRLLDRATGKKPLGGLAAIFKRDDGPSSASPSEQQP